MELYADELQTVFDKALSDALNASEATVDHTLQSNANKKAAGEGGKVQYSIVNLDSGKSYVEASRRIITGSDIAQWRKQISEFFKRSLKDGDFSVTTVECDVLTITKETAKKARSKIVTEKGVVRELSNNEFRVKLTAESHIDELSKISKAAKGKDGNPKVVSDTKNHSFAKDGFTYRTVYFKDFDGVYYSVTLSVGENDGISTVYNVGKLKADSIPDGNIVSTIGSRADMLSAYIIIPESSEKSKGKVQISAGVVSEADKSLQRAEFEIISDLHYGGDILDYKRRYKGYTEVLGFGEVGSELEEIEIGYYKRGGKWRFADIATGQEMIGSELKLADLRKYVAENKEVIIAEITTDRSNRLYEKKTATPETIYDPDEKVYGESLIDSLERTVQTQQDQAAINDYRRVEAEVSIKRQELSEINNAIKHAKI